MNKYTWDDYEKLKAHEMQLQGEIQQLNKPIRLKTGEWEIAKGKLDAWKKELDIIE